VLVRCPWCRMSVWVTEDQRCPSCRKPISASAIPADATPAATKGPAPPPPAQAASRPQPAAAGGPKAVGIPAAAFAAKPAKSGLPTARRTSWGAIVLGLLLMLFGGWFLSLMGSEGDSDGVRMSRKARAMHELLGETGTELACGLLFLGFGVGLIATCRRDVVLAAAPATGNLPTATGACDFCRKSSPDAAPAFLTVEGGSNKIPVAFRCRACDACCRASSRIASRMWLMLPLMLLGLPVVPLALFSVPLLLLRDRPLRPEGGMIFTVLLASAVAIVGASVYLHWQIRRRSVRLLGGMEPVVRSAAGVKKWGWPRRPVIRRELASELPVVNLSRAWRSVAGNRRAPRRGAAGRIVARRSLVC
jgi:hypothetical protein